MPSPTAANVSGTPARIRPTPRPGRPRRAATPDIGTFASRAGPSMPRPGGPRSRRALTRPRPMIQDARPNARSNGRDRARRRRHRGPPRCTPRRSARGEPDRRDDPEAGHRDHRREDVVLQRVDAPVAVDLDHLLGVPAVADDAEEVVQDAEGAHPVAPDPADHHRDAQDDQSPEQVPVDRVRRQRRGHGHQRRRLQEPRDRPPLEVAQVGDQQEEQEEAEGERLVRPADLDHDCVSPVDGMMGQGGSRAVRASISVSRRRWIVEHSDRARLLDRPSRLPLAAAPASLGPAVGRGEQSGEGDF